MKSTLERESKVLEIVEREAFDFSGCLVSGEGHRAKAQWYLCRMWWAGICWAIGFTKAEELDRLNGFERGGCSGGRGNSVICCLTS